MTQFNDISSQLLTTLAEHKQLGISDMIDYDKFYLYSLITHSTAIEGSTVTELENQLLFDEGITAQGRTVVEQMMNLDLKRAYEQSLTLAKAHADFTPQMLKDLSALVMEHTGSEYSTLQGSFDSSKGDFRLVNVTAGVGGRSYMNFMKVKTKVEEFCEYVNERRSQVTGTADTIARYLLSIDAHFELVTIHPWVDGNGRMSRLVMNMLQAEYGLLPIKVTKEHKEAYIQSLIDSREQESLEPFRHFMLSEHLENLRGEIKEFKDSQNDDVPQNVPQNVPQKYGEEILRMIRSNPNITRKQMAEELGVSTKTVGRELAKLPMVEYVGPAKGGHWEIKE